MKPYKLTEVRDVLDDHGLLSARSAFISLNRMHLIEPSIKSCKSPNTRYYSFHDAIQLSVYFHLEYHFGRSAQEIFKSLGRCNSLVYEIDPVCFWKVACDEEARENYRYYVELGLYNMIMNNPETEDGFARSLSEVSEYITEQNQCAHRPDDIHVCDLQMVDILDAYLSLAIQKHTIVSHACTFRNCPAPDCESRLSRNWEDNEKYCLNLSP